MRILQLVLAFVLAASTIALAFEKAPSCEPSLPGLAVAGSIAAIAAEAKAIDDPFPIQRIRIDESQIDSISKQFDFTPLVQMPRRDFEEKVRAAGKIVAEAHSATRIARSHYRSTLVGGDLVGTGELELINASPHPQFFALEPLKLALGSATWEDGRPAIVGVPPGSASACVWLDRPGAHTLKFPWSAAGSIEFGERRFELRVPPSPATLLELELPVGSKPTAASDVLLTGPLPIAGDAKREKWSLRFGSRPRLDFAIRSAGSASSFASASLAAHFEISPGSIACTYEYDLRPAKGTVGEWAFAVDPGLHIRDVAVNNRSGWTVDPPASPGTPQRLRITLNRPGTGGKILVSGIAAFPDPNRRGDAALPAVRPNDAALDEETLEIRLAPELQPTRWQAGDYRITDSQVLPDRTRLIALRGTLLPAGADRTFRALPKIATSEVDSQFATTERLSWRFGGDRLGVQLRLGITAKRSPAFRASVRCPEGYSLVRAYSERDDWIAASSFAKGIATVEFTRPLMPGQSGEIAFEFIGPRVTPSQYPLPAFTPLGTGERVGVLGIDPGPLWKIVASPGVGTSPLDWLDLGAPRPPADSLLAFRYRGSDPEGSVALAPMRAEFTADIESRNEPNETNAISRTRLTLRVRTGGLKCILVGEADPAPAGRSWRTTGGINAISSATSLPLADFVREFGLFAPSPFARATSLSAWKSPNLGSVWAIEFDRVVAGEIVLDTAASKRSTSGERSPSRPRFTVLGAAESHQLLDEAMPQAERHPNERAWAFSDVQLATSIRSESEVEVAFGGTIDSAASSMLPLRLPVGAEVRAASVDGLWVDRGVRQFSPDGILRLPIPAGESVRFTVRYRLAVDSGFPTLIRSPEPQLPVGGVAVQRSWICSGINLPLWPLTSWQHGKPADLTPSLGTATSAGPNSFTSREDVSVAAIGSVRSAGAVGIASGATLILAGWFGWRRNSSSWRLLLSLGLAAIGGIGLLGSPWCQHAAIVPMVAGLLAIATLAVSRGRLARFSATAAAFGIALLMQEGSRAQPPLPAVAFLLPIEPNGTERVLVPKAVLDRLTAVTRSAASSIALVEAHYAIDASDATARVKAKLVVQVLGDADAAALIPLTDARLESALVDGEPTFPVCPRPGLYSIPLRGGGRREIQLSFTALATGSGTERELRFGIPECPNTAIAADFPGSARQVQVVGRIGKLATPAGNPPHIEVELGSSKAVQFRWREGLGGAAALKLREACVWDVSEKGAELTACYLTRIDQGTISALRFDLPAELEPIEVAVRPLDALGGVGLRDWSLGSEQNGFREMRLDLQGPSTGRLLAILSCRPRKAFGKQPVLRFPKPSLQGGIVEADAIYGLRVKEQPNKPTIESLARIGLIDYTPESLLRDRDWTKVPDLRLDSNSTIRIFRPNGAGIPEIRPTLRLEAEIPAIASSTSWSIEPHRARCTGTIQWTCKELVSRLEFDVPGVSILEVHGIEVDCWSQSSSRVSVWFRKGTLQGELEWIGSATPVPRSQQVPGSVPFEATVPRIPDCRLTEEAVRIHPADSWAAKVDRDRGWTSIPGSGTGLAYRTSNPGVLPVRIVLSQAPPSNPIPTSGVFVPQITPAKIATSPESIAPSTLEAREDREAGNRTALSTPSVGPSKIPIAAAIGWLAAIAFLAFAASRFPGATWPEQLGLAALLLGIALLGQWWIGLAGWITARSLHALERLWQWRKSRQSSTTL